jgi:threonine/homoserine efflux transporter RhtA
MAQPVVAIAVLLWLLAVHSSAQQADSSNFVMLLHRCNMVPGYVVPCNQVAFSQPTGDGVALAAAFAGTQQFLVYGIE